MFSGWVVERKGDTVNSDDLLLPCAFPGPADARLAQTSALGVSDLPPGRTLLAGLGLLPPSPYHFRLCLRLGRGRDRGWDQLLAVGRGGASHKVLNGRGAAISTNSYNALGQRLRDRGMKSITRSPLSRPMARAGSGSAGRQSRNRIRRNDPSPVGTWPTPSPHGRGSRVSTFPVQHHPGAYGANPSSSEEGSF